MVKLPVGLTLTRERVDGPYPPKGFLPLVEHQLGNGDCYGLYWPFGREAGLPLVIEMQHDMWFMEPSFSCMDAFLAKSETSADDYISPPTLEEDSRSPTALYEQAETEWGSGNLAKCERLVVQALEGLPEFTLAWERLFQLKKRNRDSVGAANAALSALTSHAAFGRPSDQLLSWIRNMPDELVNSFPSEPILKRRKAFTFRHGGTKTNDDYPLWKECIDEYLTLGEHLKATLVHQNYGFWMCAETVSFQERYGFSSEQFVKEQDALFARTLKHNRDFF